MTRGRSLTIACAGTSNVILASLLLALSNASGIAKSEKEIFQEVAPRVVLVETYDDLARPAKQGSGIILGPSACKDQGDDNDGGVSRGSILTKGADILTNYHVIEWAEFIVVRTQDGQSAQADIVFFERARDVAVLRMPLSPQKTEMPTAPRVEVGDKTVAIGNPKGLGWTISTGIVSRVPDKEAGLIQTTAALSSGSSGGGLLDSEGRLIGITTASLESGQNLNFAVWLQGKLRDDIQASRSGISFGLQGMWRTDWIVGEYGWDDKWLFNPRWEDTYRKHSRFAGYMELRKKITAKEEEWAKREQDSLDSRGLHAMSGRSLKAAMNHWSKQKARDMAPLWTMLFREFPDDVNNALSLAGSPDDLEERAALLGRLAAKWPTNFDVLEAAAMCAHELRDFERAVSALRQLRASVVSAREKHDPKLSHEGSAELWKIFERIQRDERTSLVKRFNGLVSTLADEGLECRSLTISGGDAE